MGLHSDAAEHRFWIFSPAVYACSFRRKDVFSLLSGRQPQTVKKMFDLFNKQINEDVYRAYVFWSTVLVVKMLLMSILTGMQRFRKKVSSHNLEPWKAEGWATRGRLSQTWLAIMSSLIGKQQAISVSAAFRLVITQHAAPSTNKNKDGHGIERCWI